MTQAARRRDSTSVAVRLTQGPDDERKVTERPALRTIIVRGERRSTRWSALRPVRCHWPAASSVCSSALTGCLCLSTLAWSWVRCCWSRSRSARRFVQRGLVAAFQDSSLVAGLAHLRSGGAVQQPPRAIPQVRHRRRGAAPSCRVLRRALGRLRALRLAPSSSGPRHGLAARGRPYTQVTRCSECSCARHAARSPAGVRRPRMSPSGGNATGVTMMCLTTFQRFRATNTRAGSRCLSGLDYVSTFRYVAPRSVRTGHPPR
jgi:hypothetical protein